MATNDTSIVACSVEPLSDSTERLFRPIKFADNDRLHVSLDSGGKNFVLKFYSLAPDGTRKQPSWSIKTFVGRIPERKKGDYWDHTYHVAGTDFTAILINALWNPDFITFDEKRDISFKALCLKCPKDS